MIKAGLKISIILIIVFIICTCINPYIPRLEGYESLLVVDGLVTDESSSHIIKLSRTLQDNNGAPVTVSDATVFITDEAGTKTFLKNIGDGLYKTDSLEFRAIIGRTYILHILIRDDTEYESAPCLMSPVPEIDRLYFEKDLELFNNGTESEEGIKIYLDSKPGNNNHYYRWAFEETWKFKIPSPKRYDYIDKRTILPVANVKQYCWKTRKSDKVIIHTDYSEQSEGLKKQSISFIASGKSDRLMSEYSILVKQYSISKSEYEFWNNLKKVNESGRDIFASQPFPVISNIHNLNNPKERVLGFFQVSAVNRKRLFIPFSEVVRLQLPFYYMDQCERIEKAPGDYATPFGPPVTFDDLYSMFCIKSDYYFIEPLYNPDTFTLEKLVFARPECANCELTGFSSKPFYWIDLN